MLEQKHLTFSAHLQTGSTLSKLRNFGKGGGLNTPNPPPPRYTTGVHSDFVTGRLTTKHTFHAK